MTSTSGDNVQIMGTIGIDYTPTIQASQKCVTALEAVNEVLKKMQTEAERAGEVLATQLSKGISTGQTALEQYGKAMSTASVETGKMAQSVSVAETELAKIENRLMSVVAASQKSGVEIPGVSAHLENIRSMRDMVQGGKELSDEQAKMVHNAREFSIIQQNTLRTLEREAEAIRNMQQGEQMLADSLSRRLTAEQLARERINRQWDEYIIKQKAADDASIRKQEEAAWRELSRIKEASSKALAATTKKEIAQYDALLKKQTETFRALPALEARVASVQAQMSTTAGVTTEQIKTQAALLRTQIVQLQQRLKTEEDITNTEILQVAQLKKQVDLLTQSATIARADFKVQTEQLKEQANATKQLGKSHTFLQHRMGWFVSGTMFYGALRAARQAIDAMKEVEMGMVVIRRVTNDATIDFGKMRTELLQIGVDFGHSWDVVQEAATRWALAGYRGNEVIELTRTSLLGLNVAEMDIEMATQGLIAIMAQWGFETHELVTVIDKLNKVSDNYAVTTGDLIEALIRSSGAARAINLTFEETVGIITATRVASGRLGREVGNALNTIFAYLTRQETLNKMWAAGIEIYADSAKTKLRPAMELLAEFADRWGENAEDMPQEIAEMIDSMGAMSEEMANAIGIGKEWTELQKIDLEQSTAGIRRRSFLIALLRNFDMVQKVINDQWNAENYSMRQNAETMETLEKRIDSLKTSFTMMAVEIGEAGILEILKASADSVTALLRAFQKLPPELRKIIILLGTSAGALGVVNMAAKTFFSYDLLGRLWDKKKNVDQIEKSIKAAAGATLTYTGATGGATLATGDFATALAKLRTAFLALPLANKILLLVALAGFIHNLTKRTKESAKEIGEMAEAYLDAGRKAREKANAIETLTKRYEELAEKQELTTEENELFRNTIDKIVEILPKAIDGYDDMGKAIVTIESVARASRMELEKLNKETERSIIMGADKARRKLDILKAKRDEQKMVLDELWKAYQSETPAADLGKLAEQQIQWWGKGMTGLVGLTHGMPGLGIGTVADYHEHSREITRDKIRKLYDDLNEDYKESLKAISQADALVREADILTGKIKPEAPKRDDHEIKEIIETPAEALKRLNEERAKARHELNIGEKGTAEYLATLQRIERDMRAAGVAEKEMWAIREEIYSLQQQESKAREQWTKEQERLAKEKEREMQQKTEEYKRFYDIVFNDAMNHYRHINSLARASRDEQIRYLKDLSQAHEWEIDKQRTLKEELFRHYQKGLNDQQDQFKRAYDERISLIEKERDAKIQAIQDEMAELDKEKTSDSRLEAERQHNQKMADLLKDKQYHELRTGSEHTKAIADIERQMNEEIIAWERQQNDWRREDKKNTLQRQIEDIKKAADEEKEIWRKKYEEIKANWDKWATDFANAAIEDPKWFRIGNIIGDQLASGFSRGLEVLDMRIANVGQTVSGLSGSKGYTSVPVSGFDPLNPHYQYIERTWPGGMKAYSEGQQARYDEAKRKGQYDLIKALEEDAKLRGYPLAHIGARVQSTGWAMLKHDERVLSPQLNFQFERLVAAMQTNRISSTGTAGRGDVVFNAPLFNAQKVEFEDSQDMEIFGREIKRHIESIR